MIRDKNRTKLLDVIRGLAIILVIMYHFYPEIFLGGYSGVDVFFMLSGYLITKAIMKINNSNKHNLIEFYKSRFLRIFPGILFIILSVLTIGWFLLESDELSSVAEHAIYSIAQVMNFILWYEIGYFDTNSKYKVFLHMWSLSIEWQLYLIAPILLLSITRVTKSKKIIGLITLACSIITMIFFVYGSEYHPNGSYYFTPLRSWAFFLGASIYLLKDKTENKNIKLSNSYFIRKIVYFFNKFLFIILLLLLGLNIFLLPSYLNYGFINVISVLIISVFIILKPKCPKNIFLIPVEKLFLITGLVSFSLYLWHWPILYFIRLMGWNSLPLTLELGILITFIFSLVTYNLIEKPFNESKNRNTSVFLIATFGLLLIIISRLIISSGGATFRYSINNVKPTASHLIQNCESVQGVVDSYCRTTINPQTVLLGDSHADLLMNALIESGHGTFSKVVSMSAGNCHPSIGTETRKGCNKHINETLKKLKNMPEIKYSLISSWNIPILNSDINNYFEGYKTLFNKLHDYGIQPIFIIDNPTLIKSPEICSGGLSGPHFRKNFSNKDLFCFGVTKNDFVSNESYKKLIELLIISNRDVIFIDAFNSVCPNWNCSLIQGSEVLYSDEGHLSYFSSKKVINYIIEIVGS